MQGSRVEKGGSLLKREVINEGFMNRALAVTNHITRSFFVSVKLKKCDT